MKITVLRGAAFGTKTKIAADYLLAELTLKYPDNETGLLDLAGYNLEFSDGRHYLDYQGDTAEVIRRLMDSEVVFIVTPIYQASIPGSLKNLFDLLPLHAFRDKVVSAIAVAGSDKHYLTIEHQLKPILAFMKAHIVQTGVFMHDTDFMGDKISNDELIFRLNRLMEETMTLARVYRDIRAEDDAKYDF